MVTSFLLAALVGLTGSRTLRPDSALPPSLAPAPSAPGKDSSPSPRDTTDPKTDSATGVTVVIPIHGQVDEGLQYFVERAIKTALASKPAPDRILFDVDTWGGRLDAAFEISDAISGIKQCSTAAFVAKKAISAGALIALSTQRVYMAPGATIGDCAPIIQTKEGPQFLGEKVESPLRARFRALARRSGIPILLAEKMVTKDLGVVAAKDTSGQLAWFTAKNWDDMPDSAKSRYRDPQTVIEDGQLLTLDDQEAAKWGFSAGTYADAEELERAMGWSRSEAMSQTWSESFVRWISKFVPVLFLLGLAAVYLEYKSPGFGFFGIAGILLLALALGSQYLLGMASYTALFLAVIGIMLITLEVVVAPGVVVLAASGLIFLLAALVLSLQGFTIPDPQLPWQGVRMRESLVTVGLTALGAAILSFAALRWLVPLLPMRDGPYLRTTLADVHATTDSDDVPAAQVGRIGTVVSTLRPVGRIEVDGQEVDAVSESGVLEKGTRVRLVAKHLSEWLVEPVGSDQA